MLGGISKLGGVNAEKLLTKVAGIDNALLRVAAAGGIKLGSEVTEEELQLFLEPLYRTLVFGEDYSAPALEEILYTALLTAITTGVVEGRDIASYSDKDINTLVEQSKEQIKADGEKTLQSGNIPDDAHLEIMELNPPKARGMMAIYQMVNMEDAANEHDVSQTSDLKPTSLMDELMNSGEKCNIDEVIVVTKTTDGSLLWLEQGNEKKGLTHILQRHANDFASQDVEDVPRLIIEVLNTKPIKKGQNEKGPYADYTLNGNTYRLAYGTNGYIVSFYPID